MPYGKLPHTSIILEIFAFQTLFEQNFLGSSTRATSELSKAPHICCLPFSITKVIESFLVLIGIWLVKLFLPSVNILLIFLFYIKGIMTKNMRYKKAHSFKVLEFFSNACFSRNIEKIVARNFLNTFNFPEIPTSEKNCET